MEKLIQFQPKLLDSDYLPMIIKRLRQLEISLNSVIEDQSIKTKCVNFSTHEGIYRIMPINIVRIQAFGNYCKIFLNDNTTITCSKTMKSIAALLPSNLFLKTHQSHIVNKNEITMLSKLVGCQVKLKNGNLIPISRSEKQSVQQFFQNEPS